MKITNLYLIAVITCAITMFLRDQLNETWIYLVIMSIPAYFSYLVMFVTTIMFTKMLKKNEVVKEKAQLQVQQAKIFSGQMFFEQQKDYFNKKYQLLIGSFFIVLSLIFYNNKNYIVSIIYTLPLLDFVLSYTKNKFLNIANILKELKEKLILSQKPRSQE